MKFTKTWVAGAVSVTLLAGCGSGPGAQHPAVEGACPTTPLSVVVSVDQWGDIVDDLGGACAHVTTIIKSSSADPHEYEPTPGDSAKFGGAKLVVVNGLDYDPWANKAIATLDTKPAVVDGGKVVGLKNGSNPHIWYGPAYVQQVSTAVTNDLTRLAPKAASYFAQRQRAWQTSMQPYFNEINRLKTATAGHTFAASEPVFDDMAQAVGLQSETPPGYENASLNDSDPSAADIATFEQSLHDHKADVLIYNTQTEGPVPAQLRSVAKAAHVPVVDVTETVPPGSRSFLDWQLKQLRSLASALRLH